MTIKCPDCVTDPLIFEQFTQSSNVLERQKGKLCDASFYYAND